MPLKKVYRDHRLRAKHVVKNTEKWRHKNKPKGWDPLEKMILVTTVKSHFLQQFLVYRTQNGG